MVKQPIRRREELIIEQLNERPELEGISLMRVADRKRKSRVWLRSISASL
jgi:hypothetical protein